MQAEFDHNSYIIVIIHCHGEDIPSRFLDGSELGCYKISAAGDCGYLAHRDLRVSHALYSTCQIACYLRFIVYLIKLCGNLCRG